MHARRELFDRKGIHYTPHYNTLACSTPLATKKRRAQSSTLELAYLSLNRISRCATQPRNFHEQITDRHAWQSPTLFYKYTHPLLPSLTPQRTHLRSTSPPRRRTTPRRTIPATAPPIAEPSTLRTALPRSATPSTTSTTATIRTPTLRERHGARRTDLALLDVQFVVANVVRVSGERGLVLLGGFEVDECAALWVVRLTVSLV